MSPFEQTPKITQKYGAAKPMRAQEPLVIPAGESTLTYVTPAIAERFGRGRPLPSSAAPVDFPPGENTLTYVTPEIAARFPPRKKAA